MTTAELYSLVMQSLSLLMTLGISIVFIIFGKKIIDLFANQRKRLDLAMKMNELLNEKIDNLATRVDTIVNRGAPLTELERIDALHRAQTTPQQGKTQ